MSGEISPRKIEELLAGNPGQLLKHHRDALTPDQLSRAAAADPGSALAHALPRLSQEEKNNVFRKASPYQVSRDHLDELPEDIFTELILRSPAAAARHATRRMDGDQLEVLLKSHGRDVIQHGGPLTRDQLEICILRHPKHVITHRIEELDECQLKRMATTHPAEVIIRSPGKFSGNDLLKILFAACEKSRADVHIELDLDPRGNLQNALAPHVHLFETRLPEFYRTITQNLSLQI